jgi:hypothetical protein
MLEAVLAGASLEDLSENPKHHALAHDRERGENRAGTRQATRGVAVAKTMGMAAATPRTAASGSSRPSGAAPHGETS